MPFLSRGEFTFGALLPAVRRLDGVTDLSTMRRRIASRLEVLFAVWQGRLMPGCVATADPHGVGTLAAN